MIGVFRSNNPLNASILFVYGFLLKLYWFMHLPSITHRSADGFLYNALIDLLKPGLEEWRILEAALVYFLLFTQAMSLNYFMNSRKMVSGNNFLPAMSYLLITSLLPEWNMLSPTLIVNSILIWFFFKVSTLGSGNQVRSVLFNIGLAIGVCSFLYLPSLFFVVIVLIGVGMVRPPKIFEMGMVFLGLLTTWYFLAAALYLTDKTQLFEMMDLFFEWPDILMNKLVVTGIALLALLLLVGFYFVQAQSSKQIVRVRKGWGFVLANLILLLLIPLFQFNPDLRDWIMTLVPVSLFIGAGFYYLSVKPIRMVLHWGVVLFVVYYQYFR